jgi:hypothetical protein
MGGWVDGYSMFHLIPALQSTRCAKFPPFRLTLSLPIRIHHLGGQAVQCIPFHEFHKTKLGLLPDFFNAASRVDLKSWV